MIEIDLSKLAIEVSNILMLRGTSLPPLNFGDHAHPQASTMIDDTPDDKLFGVAQVKNTDMAMAIRSLLFLRCGWLSEGSMFAMMAPPKECEFICGIAERNAGHKDRAKVHFQKINEHPIYPILHKQAIAMLKNSMDKRLTRLHDILEVHGDWEPYAFADVYDEARAGQMSSASEDVVRMIQATEFNALFIYCYQQLMGIDVRKIEIKHSADAVRRRPTPTRHHPPSSSTSTSPATAPASKPAAEKTPTHEVRVGCPKCKAIQTFDESERGKKVQCSKCAVTFAIPGGNLSTPASAESTQSLVRVACPKCRMAASYPSAKRGSKVQCTKCNAVYTIPVRSAA